MNNRYQSQCKLIGFGEAAQSKLTNARVLVVGAGGLAASLLSYLAAAGVGRIDIIDFDRVEAANLNRQTLYTPADIGQPKAAVAAARISAQNPDINVNFRLEKLDNRNALGYISAVDLVIDACDNFITRYIINDACLLAEKAWIYAAISGYVGEISVFNSSKEASNYRDLYPVVPKNAVDCNDTGVLGALTGIIGSMQAMEAIKYLTDIGNIAQNTLLFYDALTCDLQHYQIKPNRRAYSHIIPQNEAEFLTFDYINQLKTNPADQQIHIALLKLEAEAARGKKIAIIDLRERDELDEAAENIHFPPAFDYLHLPFSRIHAAITLPQADIIAAYCSRGQRSQTFARQMQTKYPQVLICALQLREG
jgi:sulfur-carrier protein adenylyltransferase/sulfurtransferase